VIAALDGVRVLVVEDEYLVAALIEEVLQSAGCIVSGPISRLAEAMNAAGREACEIAVLDVNLAGERVFPVAEILSQRNIPFLFLTGYTTGVVPREYADRPRVCKPFRMADLLGALSSLLTPPMSNSAQPV
jgi:DNA-binding response OmpR family regulator